MPDLHDEQPPRAQKIPCHQQNPAREFQAVPSSVKRKPRLPAVFGRKAPHGRGSDVGRIGDDEIVACLLQAGEQVAPHDIHAMAEKLGVQYDLVATTDYGGPLATVIARANVAGTQFHPEKSQEAGLRLIRNFLRWCP